MPWRRDLDDHAYVWLVACLIALVAGVALLVTWRKPSRSMATILFALGLFNAVVLTRSLYGSLSDPPLPADGRFSQQLMVAAGALAGLTMLPLRRGVERRAVTLVALAIATLVANVVIAHDAILFVAGVHPRFVPDAYEGFAELPNHSISIGGVLAVLIALSVEPVLIAAGSRWRRSAIALVVIIRLGRILPLFSDAPDDVIVSLWPDFGWQVPTQVPLVAIVLEIVAVLVIAVRPRRGALGDIVG